jgi:ATP-dependent RNA helicase SUPV3L1/SUV3
VDFLVATDAIGMGLNMDVDHVAFAGLSKFDGRRNRYLHPQEIGQIAGRAGRYQRDGTFGVTGEAPDMDEDLVRAVEEHRFEPVAAAEWRSSRLEFASLPQLMASLARPPEREGLKLAAEALDESTLKALAGDPDVAERANGRLGSRTAIERLWDVCQTPDFRKLALEEHTSLAKEFFLHRRPGASAFPRTGSLANTDNSTAPTERSTRSRRGSPASARSPMSPTAPTGSPTRRAGRAGCDTSRTGSQTPCTKS